MPLQFVADRLLTGLVRHVTYVRFGFARAHLVGGCFDPRVLHLPLAFGISQQSVGIWQSAFAVSPRTLRGLQLTFLRQPADIRLSYSMTSGPCRKRSCVFSFRASRGILRVGLRCKCCVAEVQTYVGMYVLVLWRNDVQASRLPNLSRVPTPYSLLRTEYMLLERGVGGGSARPCPVF